MVTPQQRVAPANQYPPDAMPKIPRIIFHMGSAAVMLQGFMSLQALPLKGMMEKQYGGFFQYLTILGLFGTIIGMVLSGICDYLPAVQGIKSVKRVFLLFALPVEIVISSIYWSIILIAPQLMLPPRPDLQSAPEPASAEAVGDGLFRIPLWMDMSMHLLPAVALILDFFILEKKFHPPSSTIGALLLAASFGAGYSIWIEHCATINGAFPYPFLNIMDLPGRVATYVGSTLGAWVVFRGLNALHN
ncbi:hypothetical protein IAU60_002061 [Kwoniella sp. DSM 27419]